MPFAAGAGRHDTAPEGRTRSPAATAAAQGESRALGIGVLPAVGLHPVIEGASSRSAVSRARFRSNGLPEVAVQKSSTMQTCICGLTTCLQRPGIDQNSCWDHCYIASCPSGRGSSAAAFERARNVGGKLENSNLGMLGRLALRRRSTSLHPTTHSFHRQLCTAVSMQGPAGRAQ